MITLWIEVESPTCFSNEAWVPQNVDILWTSVNIIQLPTVWCRGNEIWEVLTVTMAGKQTCIVNIILKIQILLTNSIGYFVYTFTQSVKDMTTHGTLPS